MARKSKRLAINEAIRQGQAKIAEGLRTGQMRSEIPSDQTEYVGEKGPISSQEKADYPRKSWDEILKSENKSRILGGLALKNKPVVLLYAGAVVVLGLGIWLMLVIADSGESVPAGGSKAAQSSVGTEPETPNSQETGQNSATMFRNEPVSPSGPDNAGDGTISVAPVTATGDNVIWIQSIDFNRKDELSSVADFFRRKGIETEIIAVDRPSGRLAVLVTKAGFEQNPGKRGTDGYELLRRIKQLGTVYVDETKDTKFGVKPFQDVLGYKR